MLAAHIIFFSGTIDMHFKYFHSSEKRGNKVSSLQINKLVENINIYNQNGMGMTREKMLNMVKEALLTASVDSVAIN